MEYIKNMLNVPRNFICTYKYMEEAILEAIKGKKENGIPIGAILVDEKTFEIIGRSHNTRIQKNEPLGHAEVNCIQNALNCFMNLKNTTIYSTQMPCYYCAGAIIQYGISKVVAGESKTLPHAKKYLIYNGIEVIDLDLEDCKNLLQEFIHGNPHLWNKTSKKNTPFIVNKYAK